MKRTPLQRRTPLAAKAGLSRNGRATPDRERPEPPPMNFAAAAVALTHQALNHDPSGYTGPVETSKPSPRPSQTGFSYVTRQTILDRDHLRCVACGVNIDTGAVGYNLQHRDNRAMGGTRDARVNLPANGLTMCGSGTTGCHGKAEANPVWAARLGYAVESWADPETVPVLTWQGWMLLSNQGTAWLTKEPLNGDAHAVARRKEARP